MPLCVAVSSKLTHLSGGSPASSRPRTGSPAPDPARGSGRHRPASPRASRTQMVARRRLDRQRHPAAASPWASSAALDIRRQARLGDAATCSRFQASTAGSVMCCNWQAPQPRNADYTGSARSGEAATIRGDHCRARLGLNPPADRPARMGHFRGRLARPVAAGGQRNDAGGARRHAAFWPEQDIFPAVAAGRRAAGVVPLTVQPNAAPSQTPIRATTSRWVSVSRTTPLPTLPRPPRTGGLTSAISARPWRRAERPGQRQLQRDEADIGDDEVRLFDDLGARQIARIGLLRLTTRSSRFTSAAAARRRHPPQTPSSRRAGGAPA